MPSYRHKYEDFGNHPSDNIRGMVQNVVDAQNDMVSRYERLLPTRLVHPPSRIVYPLCIWYQSLVPGSRTARFLCVNFHELARLLVDLEDSVVGR